MSVKTKKKESSAQSTQRYLPFSGIRDNIVLMKDNSARLIIRCSTVNFLLKSTDEQDSIIISFQRFLNSLSFPVQIMVRSRKLDIESYLSSLNGLAVKQENSLLQKQTYEYIAYLKKLIEVAQIMRKDFYLVIPYDTVNDESVRDRSFLAPIKSFWAAINPEQDLTKIRTQIRNFHKVQKELAKRLNGIQTSLENIWIKCQPLEKWELVELLTDYYNPRMDSLSAIPWDIEDYNITK